MNLVTLRNSLNDALTAILCLCLSACGGDTEGGGTGGPAGSSGASGSSGQDASAGGAGTGGGGGSASGGSSGAAGSASVDATGCDEPCTVGRTCCEGRCVNLGNDPFNCGMCGKHCEGDTPFCDGFNGMCRETPCSIEAGACDSGSCCGTSCCTPGQICCGVPGPISITIECYTPTPDQPTCRQGCSPLCKSDRNQKREVAPVDVQSVLESVSKMPISSWAYDSDPAGVRHMGPMAQDFRAAFGLGDSDRSYHSVDAHGVALASIQALYAIAQEQNRRIENLERDNAELREHLRRMAGGSGAE